MTIGASILLIAVGAILAFAVNATIAGLDIQVVGYILILAGILGIILSMMVWGPRRRVATTRADVVEERTVTRDRDVY